MALPSVAFDKVRNVSTARDGWVIKGSRIQLTLYKYLMSVMQVKICEGKVYVFKNFSVIPNVGSFKATRHNYRIVLQRRTLITSVECDMLMNTGLSLLTTVTIRAMRSCTEFLVAVSSEREFVKNGRGRRFITMELTDHTGKLELALFGEYMERATEFFRSNTITKPVVVVQFAALGSVEGDGVIQALWHAPRMALLGVIMDGKVGNIIGERRFISFKDDFVLSNPRKKIAELQAFEGTCNKKVVNVSPRFKLRVQVCDGLDTAQFYLLDGDICNLIGKNCVEVLDEVEDDKLVVPIENDKLVVPTELLSHLVKEGPELEVEQVQTIGDLAEGLSNVDNASLNGKGVA
ncbi:Nucleic acid-binding, OB-fold [Sesbania bispinosa]|nr:Nucleic acid-binding, OB-fold [Sesbania bispinosa]